MNTKSPVEVAVERLSLGVAEIMAGLARGDVGGEDVVWFSTTETLWERCAALLSEDLVAEFDPLETDAVEIARQASRQPVQNLHKFASPALLREEGEERERIARIISDMMAGEDWTDKLDIADAILSTLQSAVPGEPGLGRVGDHD